VKTIGKTPQECVMRFVVLTMKRVAIGCLGGTVAFGAVACSDGAGLPTSPSATAAVSRVAVIASGTETSVGQATPSAGEASPHRRLFVTKTCDAAFPNTPICTVVTSEDGPLPIGTEAVYTIRELGTVLSANLVLTTPDGDTAAGHCTLSFKTGLGTCTFARGTGALAGFHANLDVTFDFATGVTTWEGTYHFAGGD
jgi:hypothetical protein